MKKTRIIALVLAVAVMMMGAGYAAWTDTLTVTHTVSTGELDVVFGEGTVEFTGNADSAGNAVAKGAGKVVTGDADNVNGSTATVTLSNLYPGAKATVTIPVENVGTIPAVLGNDNVVISGDQPSWLKVTKTSVPDLLTNGTGSIILDFEVVDGDETVVTELSGEKTFTITATYEQFNK